MAIKVSTKPRLTEAGYQDSKDKCTFRSFWFFSEYQSFASIGLELSSSLYLGFLLYSFS